MNLPCAELDVRCSSLLLLTSRREPCVYQAFFLSAWQALSFLSVYPCSSRFQCVEGRDYGFNALEKVDFDYGVRSGLRHPCAGAGKQQHHGRWRFTRSTYLGSTAASSCR